MFEPLLTRLADSYHMVAPDYPGRCFGHSDAPPAGEFAYTFDTIASVMNHFTLKAAEPSKIFAVHAGLRRPRRLPDGIGSS